MLCTTLQRNQRQFVDFDPDNPEHRDAFLKLLLNCRQDERYRFYVDLPFTTVISQILVTLSLKMCEAELAKYGLDVKSVQELMRTNEAFRTLTSPEEGAKIVQFNSTSSRVGLVQRGLHSAHTADKV